MIPALCTVFLVGALLVTAARRSPRPLPVRRDVRGSHPALVVACALGAACIALLVTPVPVVIAIAAAAGAGVPRLARRRRAARQRQERAAAWPGVLDDVTSAVRAGLNLPEALSRAGDHAPTALRSSFRSFDLHYARTGDFAAALDVMRRDVDDPVFDQLAQALAVAREVGGTDLTQVLRSLGSFIRADLQVRGELLARQSWTVNSARMAVAAPWVVLVMLSTRPATLVAYRTWEGAMVLAAVAAFSAMAYGVMLRIARIDGASA